MGLFNSVAEEYEQDMYELGSYEDSFMASSITVIVAIFHTSAYS